MILTKTELLLLDFLKDIKGTINFKTLQDKSVPFESSKQKFLDLVAVWINSDSGKIIDIRFVTALHAVSKPNSYPVISLPHPKSINHLLKSINHLLAFHQHVIVDPSFKTHLDILLLNNMFKYIKNRNYSGLEHTITQCTLKINCKLSSLELINLTELLND